MLHHPGLDYPLPDCDILLHEADLDAFGRCAMAEGWVVTAWGALWRPGQDISGRLYVRAVRGRLRLDATFECPLLDVGATLGAAVWIGGLPVSPLAELWALKLIKNKSTAAAFAARFGLQIPEAALSLAAAGRRRRR